MSDLAHTDNDYSLWVKTIRERYLQERTKAIVKVNQELLRFYWQLGKDIAQLHVEDRWGKKVLQSLSQDLKPRSRATTCPSKSRNTSSTKYCPRN
ncbi:MAG: DUF1016 N-terminal domain-containing protein [Bacteroidales bacterium]|nr:DUF1016 N-terminal domain-containing protein [Bacteroidales bacterium]